MNLHQLHPDVEEGAAGFGDFNGDGFMMSFTQPSASDSGLVNNGRVTAFGGIESFTSAPVVLSGTQTSELSVALSQSHVRKWNDMLFSHRLVLPTQAESVNRTTAVYRCKSETKPSTLSGMQTGITRKCWTDVSPSMTSMATATTMSSHSKATGAMALDWPIVCVRILGWTVLVAQHYRKHDRSVL